MKKIIWTAVVGVVVGLGVACGGTDSLRTLGGGDAARGGSVGTEAAGRYGDGTTGTVGSSQQGLNAAIRIRGENLAGLDHLLLVTRDLRVFAGSQELEVSAPEAVVVDLGVMDHAWTLGNFTVPEGVDKVRVEFTIDDFGGYEGSQSGYFDSRGSAVVFEAETETLAHNGHAVVHLNVSDSLLMWNAGKQMMLPELTVRY